MAWGPRQKRRGKGRAAGGSMQRGGACTWRGRLRSGGPGIRSLGACGAGRRTARHRQEAPAPPAFRSGPSAAGWGWPRSLPGGSSVVWQWQRRTIEREVRSLACFLWLACGSLTDIQRLRRRSGLTLLVRPSLGFSKRILVNIVSAVFGWHDAVPAFPDPTTCRTHATRAQCMFCVQTVMTD